MLRFALPPFAALSLAAAALGLPAQFAPAQEESAPVAPAGSELNPAGETAWSVLTLGGEKIGWTRTTTAPLGDGPNAGTRTEQETSMEFQRFGQSIAMTVELETTESADGALRGFTLVTKNPGAAPTRAVGVREGDVLHLTTTVGGKESTRDVDLPADLKSPAYLDDVLTGDALTPGKPLSFKTYFPELGKVGTVTLTKAAAAEPVVTPTGERRSLTVVTVAQDVLPFPTTLYVDEEGESVFESMDFLGQKLLTYEVSQEEAVRAVFNKGADMGFDTLVAVDVVPNVHSTQQVVYRVTVEGAEATKLFLSTASQQVEPLKGTGEQAKITVVGLPVMREATAGVAPDLLKSTRYLQSDDPRVIEHAKAAAPEDASAGRIAEGCAEYVSRVLTDKNFSTALASAAEVAENLSGDCTEHSVLCAAMLRARGVPSRVCVGLVTIPGRGQMGGHMWVEALLDADGPAGPAEALWVPLDPTITGGAIGGGHLLLGRSDLSDDDASPVASFLPMLEVIGRLTVTVVESK
ncbi:transglutaminase-like domain-containing protein [Alienimonas californiensis]|uniref:Transglutaminase-like superfamily protein n=1 Tax=Alienimonas californiensis TaxID=2527989 RepID=A0A517PBZ5_9PLAN|nr:transglutaminase domain-containing protein [Alienimonas californiensis]QDT16888.1 Transglutaminase-like superfamily protein [Alienimonas californiensis]